MVYFLLFVFELGLLFFLSKKVVNSLARLLYRFTRSHRVVVHTLAIIFLPGTIIHELAHLLFAGVMLVPVGELSVVPEIHEDGVKLGGVQIGRTDPFRRIIIGMAPVFLGMVLIFSIFLLIKIGSSPGWQIALGLYMLFEIGNTMFSSRKDIEGSILFIILMIIVPLVILLMMYFLSPNLLLSLKSYISQINFSFAIEFFQQACRYLIIPLVLDLLVILLTIPLSRRSY